MPRSVKSVLEFARKSGESWITLRHLEHEFASLPNMVELISLPGISYLYDEFSVGQFIIHLFFSAILCAAIAIMESKCMT